MQKKLERCNEKSELTTIGKAKAQRLANLYKMFADTSRTEILYLLQGREICVNHIAEVLNMTKSAVSHQLRLLRTAGLVRFIKEGKNSYYALDDEHVSDILSIALEHLEHK